jgi:hypothetical protein
MTPEEHYLKAEILVENAWKRGGPNGDDVRLHTDAERNALLATAQVHATLATFKPAHKAYRNPPDNSVYEGDL